ncbi:hypothetical protein M1D48_17655 [Erwinia sp. D4-22]
MKNKAKAAAKIRSALDGLNEVLVKNDMAVLSVSSSAQILKFIQLFDVALKNINSDDIPPKSNRELGIARVIVDQWPFDIELGEVIIEAEQAYKSI